jgi:hypothetical protein
MVIGSKPDGNALGNLFFAIGSSEDGLPESLVAEGG